jgi:hypothetical protein
METSWAHSGCNSSIQPMPTCHPLEQPCTARTENPNIWGSWASLPTLA